MNADSPGPGAPDLNAAGAAAAGPAVDAADPDDLICADCDNPGTLVRARRLLQAADLENSESMLGRDAWFHRPHVPLGWRVVDFDQDESVGLPPDVPTV